MASVPDVDEVRAWLGISQDTSDDDLADIIAGELASQARRCRVPAAWPADPDAYPPDLRLAVFRRCARAAAARNIPLGLVTDEYGQSRLPRWDAEVERYEAPLRKFVSG